ncbi:MAG: class I SAM-dependent methyltransferase [Planctomycetia bacterium]|nr:class I SAM-dependent methyltransferase [Planctomycetia bacterium]
MHKAIDKCRICGNREFSLVVDLGSQALTGVFPSSREQHVPSGPLELVKCREDVGGCGLVQLRHSYDPDQMYGANYGYRSGLNKSMVQHLQRRVKEASELVGLSAGDVVLDIGSNDSTTLQAYGERGYRLIGIDPSAGKFRRYYPDWVECVPDFFSAAAFRGRCGDARARIVTSISMFYDLEDPVDFMRQVHDVLAPDGIWVFEQSYLPLMVERDAYDTICHEHISYYALAQIEWMAAKAGFRILDVEMNDINGGSFCVTAARSDSRREGRGDHVARLAEKERRAGYGGAKVYDDFRRRIVAHRDGLRRTVAEINASGETVCGYGASTKGNVLLQYCEFTPRDIPCIAEVNADKFGCFTPQTLIPILSEQDVRGRRPDHLLVLPWHFRQNIVSREQDYLAQGGSLLFPLPTIESVTTRTRRLAA